VAEELVNDELALRFFPKNDRPRKRLGFYKPTDASPELLVH
jgi:hypothetical protein